MALSKIVENSIADEAVSSAKLKDFSAAVDLNGVELILDADQDTSITADTDDRIDFKIAGVEHFSFSNSSGDTIIKPMVDAKDIKFQQFDGRTLLDINDGGFVGVANGATGPGEIRIFEDTDNGANYVGLSAGSISSSITFILPTADGSAGQFLKTDGSLGLSFDTVSSAADDLTAGDAAVNLTTTSGNITIDAQGDDTDIIFKGTDGGADTTFLTIDGSAAGAASFNGAITANAGVVIDNITIDGTEIDLSSGDLTVDVAGDIILDADGADIIFKDAGTSILTITNNSTDVDFTVATQDKDIVFKGDDGGSGITALTIDMSDAGTLIANHNLELGTDASEILFGADNEVKLIHNADKGLILKHTATADDKPVILTLQTGETDIAASDVIGKVEFQAPDEGTGTDAVLVAAAIQAVSEGDFSSSSNATSLEFMTGASEAAAKKLTLTSAGHLLPASDDTQDLGSSSLQFRDIYTGDLNLNNTRHRKNEVDGTSGSWTIQEGENDLYILNRLNGKKYKFNLTEVE